MSGVFSVKQEEVGLLKGTCQKQVTVARYLDHCIEF